MMEPRVNVLQGGESLSAPEMRYFVGVERPRFIFFGKTVVKWNEVSRAFFYDGMRATNLISESAQPSVIDVMLQAGDVFKACGCQFKGVAK